MNFRVKGIAYDYRKIKPGYIYFAIDIFNHQGKERDGHEFINKAILNGARLIVVNKIQKVSLNICQVIHKKPRLILEKAAAFWYNYPAKKLITIGVTGTKGKTSTVYLINHLLQETGIKTGFFSTADFKIGSRIVHNYTDNVNETHLTCPESLELHQSLAQMYKNNTQVAIIETTSHALKLHRSGRECCFDIGVMTNFQSDHLDFHKTKEDYLASKLKLFNIVDNSIPKNIQKIVVLNIDDPCYPIIKKHISTNLIRYGINNQADIKAYNIAIQSGKTTFNVNSQKFIVPLIGIFNVYNILAAIAVGSHFGISLKKMSSILKNFPGIPGRMQEINNKKGFRVFVDYAHTPESLEACLRTLRLITSNKLILVFGCAGNRDRTKRPLMGKIAFQYADYSIITSEDPRDEDPINIIKQIIEPIKNNNYHIEIDREKAINKAVDSAKKGDVIVVTGKGDEKYMEIRDQQIKWNDVNVIKKYINE